jgi:hypothetical protein
MEDQYIDFMDIFSTNPEVAAKARANVQANYKCSITPGPKTLTPKEAAQERAWQRSKKAGDFILGLVAFLAIAGFLAFKFAIPALSILFVIWALYPSVILVPLFIFLVMFFISYVSSQWEKNQRRIIREELDRR